MNLLLLGGNSPHNKDWIEQVEKELKNLFDETKIQYYDHWIGKSISANPKKELEKAMQNVEGWSDYMIFAKSFGTSLSFHGINNGLLKPIKCIFVGVPLGRSPDKQREFFSGYSIPTLFIQQTKDRHMHFSELNEALKKNNAENYKLVEIEGSDHKYHDTKKLREYIEDFIS
jgi:hypothetical protein